MPPKRAVRMGGVGAPAYPSACVRSTIVCTQCTVPIPSGYSGDQGAPGHEFTHIYTYTDFSSKSNAIKRVWKSQQALRMFSDKNKT